MKILLENWKHFLNEATIVRGVDLEKILPQEVLDGEEDFDEEEGEEGVLVKNIPMKALSMLDQQGKNIMGDIDRGELSMTEGLPVLFYHTEKKQLIVDDGNHRIFQRWLAGQDTFDAYVYSGSYSSYLRHVHDGEEEFDWSEMTRTSASSTDGFYLVVQFEKTPTQEIQNALDGHLCRCGSHSVVLKAIDSLIEN